MESPCLRLPGAQLDEYWKLQNGMAATAVTKISTSATGAPADAGNSNPDSEFRFAGGAYIFNLQTTGLTTGVYELSFTATGDPNTHTVQCQIR